MNDAKRQQHREVVKAWFAKHPDYQRQYRERQKQLRAELGCSLNGTLPVIAKRITTPSPPSTRRKKHDEIESLCSYIQRQAATGDDGA